MTPSSQRAYLTTYGDADAEDEKFVITASATGYTSDPVKFEVQDSQTQTFVLRDPFSNVKELDEGAGLSGDPVTGGNGLVLEAIPPKTANVTFRVNLDSVNDSSDYALAATVGEGDAISQEFIVPGTNPVAAADGRIVVPFASRMNDGDRIDDTITITVWTTTGSTAEQVLEEPLEIEVIDQHVLPTVEIDGITIVVDKKDTDVEPELTLVEGELGTVTLVADRSEDNVTDEDITVTLVVADSSSADRQDFSLAGSPATIPGDETFTLDVEENEDVGPEELVLMATIAGEDEYGEETEEMMLGAITFVDGTTKQIEPKGEDDGYAAVNKARKDGAGANELWTPGETMTLKAEDLFDWPDTTTSTSVRLSNAVSEDTEVVIAGTSNDVLTITAKSAGMTEVSVTATVVPETSSFVGSQTVSSFASVKFPVMVDPYTITARSDMDVQAAADAAIAKVADEAASKQWEPNGATVMVPLSGLFDVPDEVTPTYTAESSDMGDVEAGISSDKMYVTLMPKSAGMATITVSAVDLVGETVASVEFDAMVMAPTAIVAKTQAEVDAVFMEAGAGMLTAGGDPVMVAMNELFTVAPGVEPTYSADSDMPAVIEASDSGMTATLTPLTSGTAMITVTAVDSASSSIVTVSSEVTVDSESLVVTLEMPDGVMDGNIVEGESYDIKVMANRAVTEDTEVTILRDRAASYADDDDYSVSMATIMAGDDSATAELMVTEDNLPDGGTDDNMGEMLVLYGMVDGASTNSLTFTIWDQAVPALPLFGQLLLALFLMLGGARLYRRRQG